MDHLDHAATAVAARHAKRRGTLATVALVTVALVVGAVLGPLSGAAHAAPDTLVALEYEVPAETVGCPDADVFRASVQRQLGYDPFRPGADRRVAVQIARKDSGFDGHIRWSDADGRWVGDRRLSSRHQDCKEIAANLAFSVAVQIQLLATLAPPAPEPPPPPSPPPPAPAANLTKVERPAPAPMPTSAPTPARRLALSVGFGPALALGVAPQPTGLGRLFVTGRMAQLSLELAVDAAWPATQTESNGSGFSLDRFAAGVAACGRARALGACLTSTVGVLRARGFGVDEPASPAGLFAQVGARVMAVHDLGDRAFAAAHVDGLVMLSRRTVTLNETVAWTTPRVGALIGLDFGARFF